MLTRGKKERTRSMLRSQYGEKAEYEKPIKSMTNLYWRTCEKELPQNEVIDEITWNDLEMDRVFQRINQTCCFAGEQMLYKTLHHIPKDKKALHMLEEEIQFEADYRDCREAVQMELLRLGKEESSYWIPEFMQDIGYQRIRYIWLFRLMHIILLCSALLLAVTGTNQALIIFGVTVIINLTLYMKEKGKYEQHLDTLGGIIRIVKVCKKLSGDQSGAGHPFPDFVRKNAKDLNQLTHMVAALQNKKRATMSGDAMGMLQDYLFGITLWDFLQFDKAVRILRDKEFCFMSLYEYIGRLDMAIAVASFRKSLPLFSLPEFLESEKKKEFSAEELYHPLVDHAVGNTVNLSSDCLITGSNASGKSTFIKSVAVNVILAESIHTCTAKRLVLPDAGVMTSMAIRDDMMSGESYFIREIKYLKRIVEAADEERFLLCAVDEILRGTNTKERIAASYAVLDYLVDKNCLAIVASHDVELARMLGEEFEEYYFCEKMSDDGIVFDYRIRKGVNNSRNAIRLLEYMGFPKRIVDVSKEQALNA